MTHYSRLSVIVIDVPEDNHDAEVARLETLGAERVSQPDLWSVMRDPAGLAFCVVPERAGSLNERNARRWA